jgi:bromodomain-containing factor 1
MDETAEAEKIRKLEERMRLFEEPNGATAASHAVPVISRQHDSDHSSDSSSDDSSGSESE